ncbi:MAG: hypothetical protein NC453_18500 [Muribaculum sp.]|nr:hypothetical protein [Muribaculum sp.]
MNIDELNKELGGYKAWLEAAAKMQKEIDGYERELLRVIKEEMKKRGINAIKIDLFGEIGDEVDHDNWNLMTIYEDDERREWASTVYIDNQDNIQFVASFEQDGFTNTVETPYYEHPETPAITFSVGPLDLEAANPRNYYGHYTPGFGIITDDCDPYKNGVVHLAAVFGKCIDIYDFEVSIEY